MLSLLPKSNKMFVWGLIFSGVFYRSLECVYFVSYYFRRWNYLKHMDWWTKQNVFCFFTFNENKRLLQSLHTLYIYFELDVSKLNWKIFKTNIYNILLHFLCKVNILYINIRIPIKLLLEKIFFLVFGFESSLF